MISTQCGPFLPMRYTSNEEKSDSKLSSVKWTLPVLLLGKSNSKPVRGSLVTGTPLLGIYPKGPLETSTEFSRKMCISIFACVCL